MTVQVLFAESPNDNVGAEDSESYEDVLPMGGKNVDDEESYSSEQNFDAEDDEIAQVVSTLNLLRQAVCTA